MSFRLRHDLNLLTEPSGWVDLDRLCQYSPDYPRRSIEEIRTGILKTAQLDKKGRYEVNGTRIRATNGHSVQLTQPVLRKITLGEKFEWAVHGTSTRAWTIIQSCGGLSKMTRDYVHFAVEHAHLRPSSQIDIYLYLDVDCLLRDGHTLFMTTNGVLGSVDDVPLRYLTVGSRPIFNIV
jgi:RNA:NAD 2'-phosphotransferase (TPT1/KptA family)